MKPSRLYLVCSITKVEFSSVLISIDVCTEESMYVCTDPRQAVDKYLESLHPREHCTCFPFSYKLRVIVVLQRYDSGYKCKNDLIFPYFCIKDGIYGDSFCTDLYLLPPQRWVALHTYLLRRQVVSTPIPTGAYLDIFCTPNAPFSFYRRIPRISLSNQRGTWVKFDTKYIFSRPTPQISGVPVRQSLKIQEAHPSKLLDIHHLWQTLRRNT